MCGLVSEIELTYLIMFLTEFLLTINTEAYCSFLLFFTNITVKLMCIRIRHAVFNRRGVTFHSLPASTIYLPKTQISLHHRECSLILRKASEIGLVLLLSE